MRLGLFCLFVCLCYFKESWPLCFNVHVPSAVRTEAPATDRGGLAKLKGNTVGSFLSHALP